MEPKAKAENESEAAELRAGPNRQKSESPEDVPFPNDATVMGNRRRNVGMVATFFRKLLIFQSEVSSEELRKMGVQRKRTNLRRKWRERKMRHRFRQSMRLFRTTVGI